MTLTASIAAATLLAAALNVAVARDIGGQPFADSTGGSSQAHGELTTTAAGVVPPAFSSGSDPVEASTPPADSTGGSSEARAQYLLDHARPAALPGPEAAAGNRHQPYADSTGGMSVASAEHALEAQDNAAVGRTSVAAAPTARGTR